MHVEPGTRHVCDASASVAASTLPGEVPRIAFQGVGGNINIDIDIDIDIDHRHRDACSSLLGTLSGALPTVAFPPVSMGAMEYEGSNSLHSPSGA